MNSADDFWRDGYLVKRAALDPDMLRLWRSQILSGELASGDVLSTGGVGDIVTHPTVVSTVAEILGTRPTYFGDSNVSIRSEGQGYHKDNADRYDADAPDWQSRYPIVRVGIYLQDHSRHSGGLNVRAGSHLSPTVKKGRTRYLGTRLGDLVVWNLRTTHSANGVVVRGPMPSQLPPGLARHVPHWLIRDPAADRLALFITYGAPGPHLDRYIEYLKTRSYQRTIWNESSWPETSRANAEAVGLDLLSPLSADEGTVHTFDSYQQLPY